MKQGSYSPLSSGPYHAASRCGSMIPIIYVKVKVKTGVDQECRLTQSGRNEAIKLEIVKRYFREKQSLLDAERTKTKY